MHINRKYTIVILTLVFFFTSNFVIESNLQNRNPKNGYYVTIAAYAESKENYAIRFTQKIKLQGHEVTYVYFENKKMFFVYLKYYSERGPSITEMLNIRKNSEFDDAWVYVFKDQKEPREQARLEEEKNAEPPIVDKQAISDESEHSPPPPPAIESEFKPEAESENEPEPEQKAEKDPYEGMYKMFLEMGQGRNQTYVDGDIELIDPKTGKVIRVLKSNRTQYINKPNNSNSNAQFEADIFGYRKIIHTIDLENPVNDTTSFFVETSKDSITLHFNLVRYQSGDIFTMYKVYFFSHSAIMRPESVNELDQLLEMMNENPAYKIRIHGHTNGNSKVEDARYRPEGDSNMFTLTGSIQKSSSAKELSTSRAEAVKIYLLAKGIAESRIQLKGWAGKKMLYKKLDEESIKNVRVEIEILDR